MAGILSLLLNDAMYIQKLINFSIMKNNDDFAFWLVLIVLIIIGTIFSTILENIESNIIYIILVVWAFFGIWWIIWYSAIQDDDKNNTSQRCDDINSETIDSSIVDNETEDIDEEKNEGIAFSEYRKNDFEEIWNKKDSLPDIQNYREHIRLIEKSLKNNPYNSKIKQYDSQLELTAFVNFIMYIIYYSDIKWINTNYLNWNKKEWKQLFIALDVISKKYNSYWKVFNPDFWDWKDTPHIFFHYAMYKISGDINYYDMAYSIIKDAYPTQEDFYNYYYDSSLENNIIMSYIYENYTKIK